MNAHETLEAAVRAYFYTQRLWAEIGIVLSMLLLIGASAMLWRGDAFLRGLAIMLTVIACTGAFSAALVAHKPPHEEIRAHVSDVRSVARERERVERLIDRYRYLHVLFAGIACCAVIVLLLTMAPVWQGVAVGLLVLAALGLTFEHFDRQQAIIYLAALKPTLRV
jgi:hypothetical protein